MNGSSFSAFQFAQLRLLPVLFVLSKSSTSRGSDRGGCLGFAHGHHFTHHDRNFRVQNFDIEPPSAKTCLSDCRFWTLPPEKFLLNARFNACSTHLVALSICHKATVSSAKCPRLHMFPVTREKWRPKQANARTLDEEDSKPSLQYYTGSPSRGKRKQSGCGVVCIVDRMIMSCRKATNVYICSVDCKSCSAACVRRWYWIKRGLSTRLACCC